MTKQKAKVLANSGNLNKTQLVQSTIRLINSFICHSKIVAGMLNYVKGDLAHRPFFCFNFGNQAEFRMRHANATRTCGNLWGIYSDTKALRYVPGMVGNRRLIAIALDKSVVEQCRSLLP
ncbi:hypothetical protein DdX_07032 [Ditylenchus destructor]|uniref:Uncharacterized protein n=1 Tax=Ditylenchus destructor TaxID=166010 RepID=A0AAD4N453_9BILA|nr:hypothetical protein DdX_07032 [Ditylenchus destructor]